MALQKGGAQTGLGQVGESLLDVSIKRLLGSLAVGAVRKKVHKQKAQRQLTCARTAQGIKLGDAFADNGQGFALPVGRSKDAAQRHKADGRAGALGSQCIERFAGKVLCGSEALRTQSQRGQDGVGQSSVEGLAGAA